MNGAQPPGPPQSPRKIHISYDTLATSHGVGDKPSGCIVTSPPLGGSVNDSVNSLQGVAASDPNLQYSRTRAESDLGVSQRGDMDSRCMAPIDHEWSSSAERCSVPLVTTALDL
jgi:hypothetical protein